jgi:hypothetical protein
MNLILRSLGTLSLALALQHASPLLAQEGVVAMSEADLRSFVTFGPETQLKLAECKKKSYPTCTYIWGLPDADDAARIALGGNPDGDKLLTIFAQARSLADFDRVLGSYKDAVPVEDLGVAAVWSEVRNQLSLITVDNLIIHVYVQIWKLDDPKAVALQVANFLLAQG